MSSIQQELIAYSLKQPTFGRATYTPDKHHMDSAIYQREAIFYTS
jgi:hypothetical protein